MKLERWIVVSGFFFSGILLVISLVMEGNIIERLIVLCVAIALFKISFNRLSHLEINDPKA